MSDRQLIIVGAGVTGSVAAHVFARKGWRVKVFDDGRPYAGSKASAGVIHSGWVSDFAEQDVFDGLALLDKLFGLQTTDVGKHVASWVSPVRFLQLPSEATVISSTVKAVDNGWVIDGDGRTHVGLVYVATGSWVNELLQAGYLDVPKIEGKMGTAFLCEGHWDGMLLKEWAPYKQIMVFEQEPGRIWSGDGTAILPKNYTDEREEQSFHRITQAIALPFAPHHWYTRIRGIRPYLKGQTGLFQHTHPRTYVSTAGNKSGTIWAAISARRLWEAVK